MITVINTPDTQVLVDIKRTSTYEIEYFFNKCSSFPILLVKNCIIDANLIENVNKLYYDTIIPIQPKKYFDILPDSIQNGNAIRIVDPHCIFIKNKISYENLLDLDYKIANFFIRSNKKINFPKTYKVFSNNIKDEFLDKTVDYLLKYKIQTIEEINSFALEKTKEFIEKLPNVFEKKNIVEKKEVNKIRVVKGVKKIRFPNNRIRYRGL